MHEDTLRGNVTVHVLVRRRPPALCVWSSWGAYGVFRKQACMPSI